MPPKRNTRTAPAPAAAAVAGTREAPTANPTAAGSAGWRRAREELVEAQRVARARQEVAEVPNWRWDSPVRTILLHQFDQDVGKMKLKDFVKEYVRDDYPIQQIDNYTMDVVVTDFEGCVTDGDLRRWIERADEFQLLRDVYLLERRGIVSLRQWKSTVDRDALNISAYSKGILDNAISVAEQTDNIRQLQEEIHQLKEKVKPLLAVNITIPDGFYDSVCNASWNYLVKSCKSNKEKFWLEVKKGNFPPALEWTDEEVDYLTHNVDTETANGIRNAREEELKEDEDNVQPTQERVVMKVLTSPKNWPYGLYKKSSIFDCFVTKEVERAWRVVRDDLRDWVIGEPPLLVKRRQRVLIGTPGIGKSMGVGSYLLYQLLQYDAEILPVVAYFIGNETYIFDKKKKQVTVFDDVMGLSTVKRLADDYNGYTIYDCSKKEGEPPGGLPESWGTVVISTPNENNFKDWAKQKTACRFIINCPEESDIKAMCAWDMRGSSNNLQEYWVTIKDRMSNVGPIPRFIFCDDKSYTDHCEIVLRALEKIDAETVPQYYGVGKDGLWRSEEAKHTIVKIVRLVRSNGAEIFVNKPICPRLEGKIRGRVSGAFKTDAALMAILLPLHELIPRILETVGVKAFKERNFVDRIHDKLTEFRPKGSKRPGKPWVLFENIWAFLNVVISVPPKTAMKKTNLQFMKLYIPSSETFPVVDAFFFVKKPQKTMVGIQVAKSKYHDTTTSKVKALREYLAALFVESDSFPTDFTWEIVYVQHKDNIPMTHWQECKMDLPPGQGPAHNSIREEHEAIAKHWNKKVRQYHLKISSAGIRGDT